MKPFYQCLTRRNDFLWTWQIMMQLWQGSPFQVIGTGISRQRLKLNLTPAGVLSSKRFPYALSLPWPVLVIKFSHMVGVRVKFLKKAGTVMLKISAVASIFFGYIDAEITFSDIIIHQRYVLDIWWIGYFYWRTNDHRSIHMIQYSMWRL